MLKKCITALAIWLGASAGATDWTVGIREGGGGFFLTSPDQAFHLNILGYSQFTGNGYFGDYDGSAERPDAPFGFGVRRARIDLMATMFRSWELLTEIGTPTLRIPGAVTGSDVGIVETRLTTPIYKDYLQIRIGKFVVPFSSENARSSRRLDTIERSLMLNSLIAANFLDTQMGLMLYGRVAEGIFNYYIGLFNGSGSSLNTDSDNNGAKDLQIKIVFNPTRGLTFGFAYDTHSDPTTTVTLYDHAMVPFATGQVAGRRHGFEVDLDVSSRIFSFRFELLGVSFTDTTTGLVNPVRSLWGAYFQTGIFVTGGEDEGFELIFRYELARHGVTGSISDLQSGIFGWNWYFNPSLRYQLNYIFEAPSRAGAGAYASARAKHMLLNELQVKF
jgi:phosphate-selective porin